MLRSSHTALPSTGFTLVELLLAMAISALVAVLAYTGIATAIDASTAMQAEVRQLGDLQRALSMLEEDLLQVRPRGITNGQGSQEAVFRGGAYQDVLLEFTRGGLANPQRLARSELQRVRYVLADGMLWRHSWQVLDRVDDNQGLQRVALLDGVTDVQVRFLRQPASTGIQAAFPELLSDTQFWASDWQSMPVAADASAPLPVAVSVAMTVAGFGEVLRVFELP
jgi:general secretion pathway protein J